MSKPDRATSASKSTARKNAGQKNTDRKNTDRKNDGSDDTAARHDQERLELVYRCPKCRREVTVFVEAVVICANCQRLMKPTKTDQDTLFAQAS